LRTEKDIGSKNPETTAVSGFCYAIFQGDIQKISFPEKDLWGGFEPKTNKHRRKFYLTKSSKLCFHFRIFAL